jgi:hypothetical protein
LSNDKLRKLSDDCKTPENKFQYFCKNSNATTNMIIQGALIVKDILNKLQLKNNYISCQKGIAPALSTIKTPVG